MTLDNWLSLSQFAVMAAAGFFVWWTGHQNKELADIKAEAHEYTQQVVSLAKAELLLAIERAERKAKHEAIDAVSGKLLELSRDLDDRFDEIERQLREVVSRRKI